MWSVAGVASGMDNVQGRCNVSVAVILLAIQPSRAISDNLGCFT